MCDKRLAVPVRLKIPERLTKDEETAVMGILKKWRHNRFQIQLSGVIEPYSTVDLLHIGDRSSLTEQCINAIEKRWKIEDIGSICIGKREKVDLFIVDNENLSKGFVCCFLLEDMRKFSNNMTQIMEFGTNVANAQPYEPEKFEMCIAMHVDNDGTEVWYRAQFQQKLANGRAQVGLIDFETTAMVDIRNIRKFPGHLAFGRISFIGKIRCVDISLDLLNRGLFQNYTVITAKRIEPTGRSFELQFDENYSIVDDNFEEEMLVLED